MNSPMSAVLTSVIVLTTAPVAGIVGGVVDETVGVLGPDRPAVGVVEGGGNIRRARTVFGGRDRRVGDGLGLHPGAAAEPGVGVLLRAARRQIPSDVQSKGAASDVVQDTFLEAQRDFPSVHRIDENRVRRLVVAHFGKQQHELWCTPIVIVARERLLAKYRSMTPASPPSWRTCRRRNGIRRRRHRAGGSRDSAGRN